MIYRSRFKVFIGKVYFKVFIGKVCFKLSLDRVSLRYLSIESATSYLSVEFIANYPSIKSTINQPKNQPQLDIVISITPVYNQILITKPTFQLKVAVSKCINEIFTMCIVYLGNLH